MAAVQVDVVLIDQRVTPAALRLRSVHSRRALPPDHVLAVVDLFEMGRVDAPSVPAEVVNLHLGSDGSSGPLEAEAMREHDNAAADAEAAIAVAHRACDPDPAARGWNLHPLCIEALVDRHLVPFLLLHRRHRVV
jgi:hypothetical protein